MNNAKVSLCVSGYVCACICVEFIVSCFCNHIEPPLARLKGAQGGGRLRPVCSNVTEEKKNNPLINGLELEHSTGTP